MTPDRMLDVLMHYPFPGASNVHSVALGCHMVIAGQRLVYSDDGWLTGDRTIPIAFPAFGNLDDGDRVHAEIRRVLTIVNTPAEPSPTLAEIKADCAGPDLPADDPLYDRAAAEQALAKVTAERDHLLIAESTLSKIAAALAIPALAPHDDALSMVKRLVDGYTVVSQRLAGSQKEVAEVTERATKAEARVKRLLRQRNAAHDVLDEAGFAMPQEGKRRRPLAVRVSLAHAQVWDSYDCINAIDEIAKVVGLVSPCRSDGVTEGEVVARVKALHQEDELRAAIAVAVGLDGSASLALILDTVTRDRPDDPRGVKDLRALVSYHQAPIRFNDRPLTLAERASFVILRLWQGRTNAANEAAALRRELGDIEAALGDLPDTAEREPIGDREEHLGLSTAERIRLAFTH